MLKVSTSKKGLKTTNHFQFYRHIHQNQPMSPELLGTGQAQHEKFTSSLTQRLSKFSEKMMTLPSQEMSFSLLYREQMSWCK